MSEAIQNFKEIVILWRLAILRLLLACLTTAGSYYLGAMGNQSWASLDGDSKFKFFVGLMLATIAIVAAFLDKTTSRISSGQFTPPGADDTQIVTRTETQISSVATSPVPIPKVDDLTITKQ